MLGVSGGQEPRGQQTHRERRDSRAGVISGAGTSKALKSHPPLLWVGQCEDRVADWSTTAV